MSNDYIVHLMSRYEHTTSRIAKTASLCVIIGYACLTLLLLSLLVNIWMPSDIWHHMGFVGAGGFMLLGICTVLFNQSDYSEIENLEKDLHNHLDLSLMQEISSLAIDEKSSEIIHQINSNNHNSLPALHMLYTLYQGKNNGI